VKHKQIHNITPGTGQRIHLQEDDICAENPMKKKNMDRRRKQDGR
jgi:hypothetical protein